MGCHSIMSTSLKIVSICGKVWSRAVKEKILKQADSNSEPSLCLTLNDQFIVINWMLFYLTNHYTLSTIFIDNIYKEESK